MINIIHNKKLHFRTGFNWGDILLEIQYDSSNGYISFFNLTMAGICGVNNFMSWDDEYTVGGINLLSSFDSTFYENL